jgi:membrane protein
MTVKAVLNLFRATWQAFQADKVPRLGAALAYYTLFAIAPVLLVVIAIAGLVFGADAVRGEIVTQIGGLIGRDGARTIQSLLAGVSRPRQGTLGTIAGGVTFLLAASGAFLQLQDSLNTIWRVKPKRGPMLRSLLLHRLRSFGIVVSIGFVLMVSLAVSAALSATTAWFSRHAPGWPVLLFVLNWIASIGITTVLFMLLFRILPDVHLRWRDVAIGALVTALLFTAGKTLIGFYLGRSSVATTYGAAASVIILMLWVYYTAQIVLLGAEFTRAYTEHTMTPPRPMAFAEEHRALGDT